MNALCHRIRDSAQDAIQAGRLTGMMLRISMGLAIAAALIPVSLFVGLPAGKSILISALTGLLFIVLSSIMAKAFPKS
jgi:hypothetical protein